MRLRMIGMTGMLATAALLPATLVAQSLPQGDAKHGGQLFLQCRACHAVVADAPDGVGPNLRGVVEAPAGGRPGYSYSPALAKSGLVWNAATLDHFLQKPSALVPGTKMAFGGLANPQFRADIIAYLATLKAKK